MAHQFIQEKQELIFIARHMTDDGRAKQTQQQNATGFNYKLRVTPLWSTKH
jgi:hypothetical protein